jgi:demethylmenaquinone methyltransferase/2-methoxy-6-polyprenyl-1,4-benzoquinol methylase
MDSRKKYFESFAEEWDKNFTAEDLEFLSHILDSFGISRGDKIADLGCGTGVLFDYLRRKVGPEGFIVGVDFSSRMIEKARLNFPFPNCLVIDAEAENLPLKSESFDLVVSFAAFAHFADKRKVILEASRILKSGGKLNILHLLGSNELKNFHHQVGGPVAMDHLPPYEKMMQMLDEGRFINAKITDHPGLYLASAVRQ